MTEPRTMSLNDLVNGQRLGRGPILLIVIAVFVLVSDGFDLAAMGYIAPELLKQWHLAPARMVPAFSAGIIGMMIGGPLLGWLGDRHGRKRMIVAGLCVIGAVTLVTIAVRSVSDLVVLRFLTGLGLGGVIPNMTALVAETLPQRMRGRALIIVTLGVALGIALPGLVSAVLVPRFGWPIILMVGGLLPIAVALATWLLVPESIKYLVERGGRDADALRQARLLRPDLVIDDDVRLVLSSATPGVTRGSARSLFFGQLAVVTPLLWICQASNQMANFFSLTWLPTLLQSAGAGTTAASASASLFSIGGLLSGVVLLFVIDRIGIVSMVALFLVGAPLVACMAATEISPALHALIIASAGFCVVGVQLATTTLLGLLYPTSVRSVGTGWTQAAGRVGALAAPVVGGFLLDTHIPIGELPFAPAGLLVIGGIASIALAIICRRRFGGYHVEEFAIADVAGGGLVGTPDGTMTTIIRA